MICMYYICVYISSVSCLFFQAEDGIRVLTVTGVQTCALPISRRRRAARELALRESLLGIRCGTGPVPRSAPAALGHPPDGGHRAHRDYRVAGVDRRDRKSVV